MEYLFLRQHIEKIVSLTDEEFDFVKSKFHLTEIKKHQFLIREGERVPYDFLVVQGLLKSSLHTENGKQHILQFAMEDWWITDYQAYLNGTKATLNVDSLEDSKLLAISSDDLESMCKKLPKMEYFFRKKSNRGYAALHQRVLCLLSSDAQSRFDQFLKQYPKILQRLPKYLIASYLGVSRETLSRLH
ncbi:MAG: Crp/Fnr family transcriptional regulator [Flavobacteriaceae bacterium]|jgi:cyclic nucleotide-binding protein|nr:Crp/Fnr family transcriptional regulator [Flavobacteriaceae bacterium]